MGIPENLQVDNEMAFFGSPAHPRGMGPLIRLCLLSGVHLWFIPPAEPWRNGVIEKFNDHYRQKFLAKVPWRQCHSSGRHRWHTRRSITAPIGTASSTEKRRSPPWRGWEHRWSFPTANRPPGIPWRNREPAVTTSCDSSGAIAISTSSANCSPRPGDPVRIRGGNNRCPGAKAEALPGGDPGCRIQVPNDGKSS